MKKTVIKILGFLVICLAIFALFLVIDGKFNYSQYNDGAFVFMLAILLAVIMNSLYLIFKVSEGSEKANK
ncbi:MAG TPA: hypothetical protein GXZ51_01345 [Acholeplasma sp.]|nr:hypothetical protein [Acholeplasma sp.]